MRRPGRAGVSRRSFVPWPTRPTCATRRSRLRREQRLTIDELAECLALSRTTVYLWVRDLPLERTGRQNRGQRLGNAAMQAKYRRLREQAYAEGRRTFAALAEDPLFRDFVTLYIAEGYKRSRNVVSLCNSERSRCGSRTYGSAGCPTGPASTASSTTRTKNSTSCGRSGALPWASIGRWCASSASPTAPSSRTAAGDVATGC
ncbi:MAG TPA: hypothetical protein VH231_11415 [Solirubrobacteraceae bacterium]|nr:hypothetical protein [Solirubrobacteraceae bacterium]